MEDNTLDEMDRLLAQSHLDVLRSGEANASDRQAARQYLSSKGYSGPSVAGHDKAGDGHPILSLAKWTDEDQRNHG